MKIRISGIITGAEFDDEFSAQFIERGILTPVSYFDRQIKQAEESGEGVEIYVNSYGGSVDAGNEMLARIQDFKGSKKLVVGSIAASQAANIVLQCGCRVEAHENSRLMFHSAWGTVEGGAGAMEDAAREIAVINKPMMDRLIQLGVPRETVEEGFSEGRQFVMGAEDALSYGIVHKILTGADGYTYRPTDSEIKQLAEKSARIAAYIPQEEPAQADAQTVEEPQADAKATVDEEQIGTRAEAESENDSAGEEAATEAEESSPVETPSTEQPQECPSSDPGETTQTVAPTIEALEELRLKAEHSEENARKIQSAASKRIDELQKTNAQLAEQVEALRREKEGSDRTNADLQQRISALETERKDLLNRLATAKRNHAQIVGNVLSDDTEETPDWVAAVRKHGPEKAMRMFPDLARDYREAMAKRNAH